jgi:hypothetical protein
MGAREGAWRGPCKESESESVSEEVPLPEVVLPDWELLLPLESVVPLPEVLLLEVLPQRVKP